MCTSLFKPPSGLMWFGPKLIIKHLILTIPLYFQLNQFQQRMSKAEGDRRLLPRKDPAVGQYDPDWLLFIF